MLTFAYERQKDCDPDHTPYYFGCFKDIAKNRESTELDTVVAVCQSKGEFTVSDVDEAYNYFGIGAPNQSDDDHIIGVFNSRLANAPRQEQDMRYRLRIIGQYRRSDKIVHMASNSRLTEPPYECTNGS